MSEQPYIEFVEVGGIGEETVYECEPDGAAEWIARNPENLIGVRVEWSNGVDQFMSIDEFMHEWDRKNKIR